MPAAIVVDCYTVLISVAIIRTAYSERARDYVDERKARFRLIDFRRTKQRVLVWLIVVLRKRASIVVQSSAVGFLFHNCTARVVSLRDHNGYSCYKWQVPVFVHGIIKNIHVRRSTNRARYFFQQSKPTSYRVLRRLVAFD